MFSGCRTGCRGLEIFAPRSDEGTTQQFYSKRRTTNIIFLQNSNPIITSIKSSSVGKTDDILEAEFWAKSRIMLQDQSSKS